MQPRSQTQTQDLKLDTRPRRAMPSGEFKRLLASKGWSLANAAYRWKITPQHLTLLLKDSSRPVRWDDAARGLRTISRLEAKRMTEARLALTPPRQRGRRLARYRYGEDFVPGAIVALTAQYLGHKEGETGVVIEADLGESERYLVKLGLLEEWITADDADCYFAATGRVIKLTDNK